MLKILLMDTAPYGWVGSKGKIDLEEERLEPTARYHSMFRGRLLLDTRT